MYPFLTRQSYDIINLIYQKRGVKMENETVLDNPVVIGKSHTIENPDQYIDMLSQKNVSESFMKELEFVKTLSNEEKIGWLLALPEQDKSKPKTKLEPATTCAVIIVTATVCTWVAYEIYKAGKKIIEKRKECHKEEIEKCVPNNG